MFPECFAYMNKPFLVVEVAADGFGPRRTSLPVQIIDPEDWDKFTSDQKAKHEKSNEAPGSWLSDMLERLFAHRDETEKPTS